MLTTHDDLHNPGGVVAQSALVIITHFHITVNIKLNT